MHSTELYSIVLYNLHLLYDIPKLILHLSQKVPISVVWPLLRFQTNITQN